MSNPVVIFCYRRSIIDLISSLRNNPDYDKTKFYIFSDGWKSEKDKVDVDKIRKELAVLKTNDQFEIQESSFNKGLANSVIDGVSYVIRKHGSVIVLEDDLVVSPFFLEYMNSAIDCYKDDCRVWSISGYSPPVFKSDKYNNFDVFLFPRGSSWGWATWSDRWEMIDWNISNFNDFKENRKKIMEFEKGGNDLYKMLELQMLGEIDSWAIRWYFNQFVCGMSTLYPRETLVVNKGFNDGFGTHTKGNYSKWRVESMADCLIDVKKIAEAGLVYNKFLDYHQLGLITKIGYLSKKYGGYNVLKKIQMLFLKITNKG